MPVWKSSSESMLGISCVCYYWCCGNNWSVPFGSHSVDQTSLKDREVKSLRRQLDSRDEELAEMTRGREMALRENRRLQSDLGTMTEENQSIHQQLQDSLEEQETLKTQITEYARQVARVEELLAEKVGDHSFSMGRGAVVFLIISENVFLPPTLQLPLQSIPQTSTYACMTPLPPQFLGWPPFWVESFRMRPPPQNPPPLTHKK